MHIVMDIGGTNMRVAAVANDVLGDIKKVPTPKNPIEGIVQFVALARECAEGEEITAVAGCIAADTISDEGVISGARNLRAWEGTNIVREFSNNLGVSVRVVNDAALAGLGEFSAGAGRGATTLAYITVSTGVGGGQIVSGKITAAGGIAGIKINGVDLEDLVSGTAVTKKFGVHPKDLDSLEERNKLADTLAEGLRVVTERWSPDTIVLGGSMIVGVNPIPIARVQESLKKLLTVNSQELPIIKMAELGDNGGLWGGLALLKQTS
ncbi:ROK family protein [Candidatus Kaiserbacteria bacterium]|nr:ROK family protein [Candidatus Kaiserbacteria bacterium]